MNKTIRADSHDLSEIANEAKALMTVTADVAGEKVEEARKRLTAALNASKELAGRVRDSAVDGARAADETVREYPYQGIGIAFGVGLLVGFLAARR